MCTSVEMMLKTEHVTAREKAAPVFLHEFFLMGCSATKKDEQLQVKSAPATNCMYDKFLSLLTAKVSPWGDELGCADKT